MKENNTTSQKKQQNMSQHLDSKNKIHLLYQSLKIQVDNTECKSKT